VLAPVGDRLQAPPAHPLEFLGSGGLVDPDRRAVHGQVQANAFEVVVWMEDHPPGLAITPGVHHHEGRVQGEDRDEADPELADLGQVAFLRRGEEPRQLGVQDLLVHPLPGVLDREDGHPLAIPIVGNVLGADIHPIAPRVQ